MRIVVRDEMVKNEMDKKRWKGVSKEKKKKKKKNMGNIKEKRDNRG